MNGRLSVNLFCGNKERQCRPRKWRRSPVNTDEHSAWPAMRCPSGDGGAAGRPRHVPLGDKEP